MHPLTQFCLVIGFALICGLGYWQWREGRRHRAEERKTRAIAEAAASEAASCAAVIDKMGKRQPIRRRLYAVRDEKSGVSTWQWE